MFVKDKTRTFGGPIWEMICFFCITRCGSETEILWIWRETISKRTTRTFCPTLYYLNIRYHFYCCWSLLCANYQQFDLLDKIECLLGSHFPSGGNLSTSPYNSRQYSFLMPFHWLWTSIILRSERRRRYILSEELQTSGISAASTSMQLIVDRGSLKWHSAWTYPIWMAPKIMEFDAWDAIIELFRHHTGQR